MRNAPDSDAYLEPLKVDIALFQAQPDCLFLDFRIVNANLSILREQVVDDANSCTLPRVASILLVRIPEDSDFLVCQDPKSACNNVLDEAVLLSGIR